MRIYRRLFVVSRYHDRRGVDIGTTHILLDCALMTGRKYVCGHHGNITLDKQWAATPTQFAFQTGVKVWRRGRGSSGTVVAHWTAGRQVKQAIFHLGHDSYQNHLISYPCCSLPNSAELWPKNSCRCWCFYAYIEGFTES